MTTYRLLLVFTAAFSALLTAVFIDPASSVNQPADNQRMFAWGDASSSSPAAPSESTLPSTMTLQICTANGCDYVELPEERILRADDESNSHNDQYHLPVPFQLPQQGVPIIEM